MIDSPTTQFERQQTELKISNENYKKKKTMRVEVENCITFTGIESIQTFEDCFELKETREDGVRLTHLPLTYKLKITGE